MDKASPQQLALGVHLQDDANFENFYLGPESESSQVIDALQHFIDHNSEQSLLLWGQTGAGLSHLLQASCHYAQAKNLSVQYLPLKDLAGFAPESLLDGLEQFDLVCLDNLELVLGQAHWEHALFNLYNRIKDAGKRILFSAHQGPQELAVDLADLKSRLSWGLVFQLSPMTDEEKQKALQLRAKLRGLDLSEDVAQFILHRAPRNMQELFYCLDKLDDASLAEQRKLTIPFVKQVLGF